MRYVILYYLREINPQTTRQSRRQRPVTDSCSVRINRFSSQIQIISFASFRACFNLVLNRRDSVWDSNIPNVTVSYYWRWQTIIRSRPGNETDDSRRAFMVRWRVSFGRQKFNNNCPSRESGGLSPGNFLRTFFAPTPPTDCQY